MLTEEMKQIIKKVDLSWPKDYIIRYLYIKLAPFFKRDIKYFLASEEEKWREYNQGFVNRGRDIVCSTLADFYVKLFDLFGIKSQKIIANSSKIPLFAIIVEGDNGWFFIDPINDLFPNQLGIRSSEFGKIPHYKTLINNYPFLISLSDDYLDEIDRNIMIGEYLDNFFKLLHLEMTNRNNIYEHFGISSRDNLELFAKRMKFASEYLINLGKVNGPFERNHLYLYLENKLFFRGEKKFIKISLDKSLEIPTPIIEYQSPKTGESIIFQETKENDRYVLRKVNKKTQS